MQVKKGRAITEKTTIQNTSKEDPNSTILLSNGLSLNGSPNGALKMMNGGDALNLLKRVQTNQWRVGFDERVEPFWGFALEGMAENGAEINDEIKRKRGSAKIIKSTIQTQKEFNRTILLIGQRAEAPPTQLPMKIRRFDQN